MRAGATRIHVTVAHDTTTVTAWVSNDVVVDGSLTARGPGLGSAIFDELADHWALTVHDGQAEFQATMALPHIASTDLSADDSVDATTECVIAEESV